MALSILATKLYIPPPRPNVVLRPRLIEQLNEGLQRMPSVTLISAPVGYGKTTLISEWVAGPWHRSPGQVCERPVAWLSLDEGDNDPTRFLTYLVAALQTLPPKTGGANIGAGVMGVLQAPQLPQIESIMTGLLNEIAAFPNQFILVLDDYHVIDSKTIDQALAFMLEHLPTQMHLVIVSREDPNLPLARLRAQGQLTELRAADLRFSPAEAAEFLNRVMSLNLSAEDVTALENHTEGWIAGLQLAALSARGRDDIHEFIRSFAGDNRYIVDYLVEEVLQRQPERVRSFLLQTSILDWLSGPLCDAVTGQVESNGMLEFLERGNFFVIPLDDNRNWYRYHHLFAEILHAYLIAEQPDQVAALHRRASEWYEQYGSAADAIHHALAAEDFERAADLIETAVPAMRRGRQEATMLGWLKALPDELVRCRPVLSVYYAGALLLSGELEGVEPRLRDAERWLDSVDPMDLKADMRERQEYPAAGMVIVDEEEFHRLPGMIAILRAGQALARGDMPETVKNAQRVLDLALEDDHLMLGGAAAQLGFAYWTSGDLEVARRSYTDGMARLQKAGHISDTIGLAIALADIQIAQGCLTEAMRTYERGLQLTTEQGTPVVRGAADMHVGMSELYCERNELNVATQHLMNSKELGELAGLPKNPYRWRVAMARIREAQGDLDGALDLLHEAERLYVSDFFPDVRPIAAIKTRLWVAQGRLGEALDWAREQGLSADDNLSYLREFEHITLARVLLARYQRDRVDGYILETMGLLERLLKAAEEGGRTGSAIEILVLQALVHQAQGDIPDGLMPLHRALKLAEPEGYVRMFLDEGPTMAQLLSEAAARGIMPDYIGKLLTVSEAEEQKSEGKSNLPVALPEGHREGECLSEPLSQRELEILRLIAQGLSNREISERLFLALNTVKGHNQKIYSKLQVQSRTEAIARARELDLL